MDPALNNYLKAADMAYDIGEIHALTPDCAHHDTLLRQQEVLGLLDQAVGGGYVQAYPMKALLSCRRLEYVPPRSSRALQTDTPRGHRSRMSGPGTR